MNQLIMALTLILGSQAGLAGVPMATNEQPCSSIQGSSLVVDNELIGQKGVYFFGNILKNSRLYGFLLSLESNVPELAGQLKYLALLNEAHLANQTLTQLLVELKKNNQLLEHHNHKGGAMDG